MSRRGESSPSPTMWCALSQSQAQTEAFILSANNQAISVGGRCQDPWVDHHPGSRPSLARSPRPRFHGNQVTSRWGLPISLKVH